MRDISRLQAAYPDFGNIAFLKSGRVRVDGEVVLKSECGVAVHIGVAIEFSEAYPDEEPRVYDADNRFEHIADRHFFPSGRMCLWLPVDTVWRPEDPDAIITLIDHVMIFLDRQLIYDVTGKWPGGERSHGQAGYREYIKETEERGHARYQDILGTSEGKNHVGRNAPCPCGSGRKHKNCHGAQ